MISAEELTVLSDRAVGRLLPKIALLEADAILALTPSFDFVQLSNMYLCKNTCVGASISDISCKVRSHSFFVKSKTKITGYS